MKKINKELIYNKYQGKCTYTGKPLDNKWQVDHMISKFEWDYNHYSGSCDDISNLYPTIGIVNHYKRSKNLEQFREYMLTFHLRLAKLPKKTSVEDTKKRILYMNTIADLFNITVDQPFNGTFYFEGKINL